MGQDKNRSDEVLDLQHLMGSMQGRRFLGRILGYCGILEPSFNTDDKQMAMREGQRDVGLWLKRELEDLDDEAFIRVLREQIDDRRNKRSRRDNRRSDSDDS